MNYLNELHQSSFKVLIILHISWELDNLHVVVQFINEGSEKKHFLHNILMEQPEQT